MNRFKYSQKHLPPPPSYFTCSRSSCSITTVLYLIVPSALQYFSNNRSITSAASTFSKHINRRFACKEIGAYFRNAFVVTHNIQESNEIRGCSPWMPEADSAFNFIKQNYVLNKADIRIALFFPISTFMWNREIYTHKTCTALPRIFQTLWVWISQLSQHSYLSWTQMPSNYADPSSHEQTHDKDKL